MEEVTGHAFPVAAPTYGGIDEAGRGPLAGPVVAAAVVLEPGCRIPGVDDSKRMTARRREEVAVRIRAAAVAWAIAVVDVEAIDRLNIRGATLLAMQRAVAGLRSLPLLLRVDGRDIPVLEGLSVRVEPLVGGDRWCPAIGAASILAKVHRDQLMSSLDARWPAYGFARHKGYPTRAHRQALLRHGPCPAHRHSFAPVRAAAALHGDGVGRE